MSTTRQTVSSTSWTEIGTGPLAVAMDRGSIHFDIGATAPTEARSGYLHSAQGQMRLVNFGQAEKVWARAHKNDLTVTVVTGALSSATPDTADYYETYADLPDPTTQQSGTLAVVLSDPNDSLNGFHVALGAPRGQMARWWRAA